MLQSSRDQRNAVREKHSAAIISTAGHSPASRRHSFMRSKHLQTTVGLQCAESQDPETATIPKRIAIRGYLDPHSEGNEGAGADLGFAFACGSAIPRFRCRFAILGAEATCNSFEFWLFKWKRLLLRDVSTATPEKYTHLLSMFERLMGLRMSMQAIECNSPIAMVWRYFSRQIPLTEILLQARPQTKKFVQSHFRQE